MPSHVILFVILTLTVWQPDETIRRYGGGDRIWELTELQGMPFGLSATITFPSRNVVAGEGPCNTFHSRNSTPYPWFELGPIAATRRACPDLADEARFFEALGRARIAVIEDDTLTISTEEQTLMVFTARD